MTSLLTPALRQTVIVVAVGLALTAQQLAHEPSRAATGWMLFAGAAGLIVLAAWSRREPPAEIPPGPARSSGGTPAVGRLGWGALAVLAVATTTTLSTRDQFPILALLCWMGSFVFASAALRACALCPPRRAADAWTRRECATVGAIVLFAAAARFVWLDSLPTYFFGDEPRVGVYLIQAFSDKVPNFFKMGWNTWPVIGLSLQGIFAPLLGLRTLALRSSSAVAGTLAVLATYLLARQLFSRRMALLAALLYALCRTAIDFSRMGICHAQVMLFETLAFFFWWHAINTGKAISYLWAGIGLGLCLYTYNAGQLVPVLWLGWIVLCLAVAPRLALTYWRGAVVTLAGLALTIFPFYFYVTDHFTFGRTWYEYTFMARDRQVTGQVLNAWSTGGFDAAFAIIWEQVLLTWLGFTLIPAGAYAIGYRGSGMLDDVTGPLFVIGLALSLTRLRRPRYAFLLYWWLVTAVTGSVLTAGPPATVRLIGLLSAVAILAALPLDELLQAAAGSTWRTIASTVLAAVLVSGAAWDNWRTYFVAFPRDAFDPTSELAHLVQRAPRNAMVLLAGSEHFAHFNQELFAFEFPDRRLTDVIEPAHLLPLHFAVDVPVVLAFGPTQLTLADYAESLYPGATAIDVRSSPNQAPLFRSVQLSPEQIARHWGLTLTAYDQNDAAISTSVADPFASTPTVPGGTARLVWRGRVYWPTDRPTMLTVKAGGPLTVRLAQHAISLPYAAPAVTVRIELSRGWQPVVIEETAAAPRSFAMSLEHDGVAAALAAPALRPDGIDEGLSASWQRDGQTVLRTIEPQLNSYTVEALFRPVYHPMLDLPLRMPFSASWKGSLWVEQPGKYTLEALGSGPYEVRLDGTTLFDETNIIPEEPRVARTTRTLAAGLHPLAARWDSTRPAHTTRRLFQLYWTPPGGERRLIPPSSFRQTPEGDA